MATTKLPDLDVKELEGSVTVRVADTGTGMDEETRRRVFEPFFTTKSHDKGTGLGLSTVWGLVQSQGGTVTIDSTPGEGTELTIRIPVISPSIAQGSADLSTQEIGRLHILVVDDDLQVRDFMPRLLVGHQVEVAANGEDGLRRFLEKRHDLVIADWVMPGLSGLEVTERVKEIAPETATVLMTGWEYHSTDAEKSPSIDVVVAKPFDAAKLQHMLAEVQQLRVGIA